MDCPPSAPDAEIGEVPGGTETREDTKFGVDEPESGMSVMGFLLNTFAALIFIHLIGTYMAYSGFYHPKNLSKYKGDSTKIKYRSLLERRVMVWLDNNPRVIEWQSEMVIIKYISPLDNKVHRYFTDFSVHYLSSKDVTEKYIIEVKPAKQCKPPSKSLTKSGKQTSRYLKEARTYAVNDAKWTYAKEWCKDNGYTFQIWTENIIDKVTGVQVRKPRKIR